MKTKKKSWWGDPDNAQKWINQNSKREKTGDIKFNTTIQSVDIVLTELKKVKFESIVEVGSGTGRLIGAVKKKYPKCNAFAVDINSGLLQYVEDHHPSVIAVKGNVTKLPFQDEAIDVVFTYQVLQHIDPTKIKKALNELQRIAIKEVWMWEGIGGVEGYAQGAMTHKAHDGSYVWYIDKMVKCYDIVIPKNENITLDRQRLYKVKV